MKIQNLSSCKKPKYIYKKQTFLSSYFSFLVNPNVVFRKCPMWQHTVYWYWNIKTNNSISWTPELLFFIKHLFKWLLRVLGGDGKKRSESQCKSGERNFSLSCLDDTVWISHQAWCVCVCVCVCVWVFVCVSDYRLLFLWNHDNQVQMCVEQRRHCVFYCFTHNVCLNYTLSRSSVFRCSYIRMVKKM